MENSDFIARFIELCDTSQPRKAAQKLEISYQAARNYFKGRLPGSNALLHISRKTSCSIHWLLTGEGEKFVGISQKEDTPLPTDEMRAFVRHECLEVLRELLDNHEEFAQEKTVILTSQDILEEKTTETVVTRFAK